MFKYVVGVCPDGMDVEVVVVEADDELGALAESVFAYSESQGTRADWDLPETNKNLPYKTIDDGITFFIQGGIALSKPLLLTSLI